jgi:membrane fusion protein (multidrug efflux system)
VPLGTANLIGREELQHARDAVASAQAQLDVAIQQYNANQAMVLGTSLENQPAVKQARPKCVTPGLPCSVPKSSAR